MTTQKSQFFLGKIYTQETVYTPTSYKRGTEIEQKSRRNLSYKTSRL